MGLDATVRVVGVLSDPEHEQKMKDVLDACEKAGISPPEEVETFFEEREEEGLKFDETTISGVFHTVTKEFNEEEGRATEVGSEYEFGWLELDTAKLPPTIRKLRIFISY